MGDGECLYVCTLVKLMTVLFIMWYPKPCRSKTSYVCTNRPSSMDNKSSLICRNSMSER